MCINENVINQLLLLTCSLIMAQMFSISDSESETETSEDCEESGQMKNNKSPQRKQHLPVSDKLKGESVSRTCGIDTQHTSFLLYPGYTAQQTKIASKYKNVVHCTVEGTLWWHWL